MKPKTHLSDDLRPEYHLDYSKATHGKYYKRILKEGANVAVLEPDVAKAFPNSEAVNEALLGLLMLTEQTARITGRSKRTPRKRATV